MNNSDNSTAKLIITAVVGGIVLLVLAAVFLRKPEVVNLPVVFEEFTDFQCPACAIYHPLVNQLKTEYSTDNVEFVFRNYPLLSLHPNVLSTHIAAAAAKEQGKFDEYANLLFENQDKFTNENYLLFAQQIGLDMEKFTADLQSADVKAKVDADMLMGESRGINATPTFYINGKRVIFKQDDNPEIVLRKLLDEKIELAYKQK